MFASGMAVFVEFFRSVLENFDIDRANRFIANAGQSGAISVSVVEAMIAVSHSNTPFCIISGWIIAQLSIKGKLYLITDSFG